jgi:hypothetical protein
MPPDRPTDDAVTQAIERLTDHIEALTTAEGADEHAHFNREAFDALEALLVLTA